jgi:5'-methylthioadenosine phosphorylase
MSNGLIGIIGGTGLGDELAGRLANCRPRSVETPFGRPSAPILTGSCGGREIAFLNRHGEGHGLSPSEVPYAANIFAMKKLGVRAIVASCAVGSLREDIHPGELVIVDQFIDKTFRRRNTFFDGYGAVHCEFAEPTCRRLGDVLIAASKDIESTVHPKGCYVCMEGPQFSSRAESLMHRLWGGDLIGMTAMPEARLAREAQVCYALVAITSDYDCWRPHEDSEGRALLAEIIGNLKAATANCLKLLEAVLEQGGEIISGGCACRKSLELAVWTDPARIDAGKKKELGVLFD